MKSIAIIPARGGSKRIPRKNIKNFLGKPIISYSLDAALQSKLFDEVMVSTDDEEILNIALENGAKVPFLRSKKNAGDLASTYDVLEEVILEYKKNDKKFDYICCIYPTAPFVTSKKLCDSFNLLKKNNWDSIFPVVKFSYPIQRAIMVNTDSKMSMFDPKMNENRSQDLPETFHDAGQFYWFKTNKLLESKKIWTKDTRVIKFSELEVQDIDNIDDWNLAELKYKSLNKIN